MTEKTFNNELLRKELIKEFLESNNIYNDELYHKLILDEGFWDTVKSAAGSAASAAKSAASYAAGATKAAAGSAADTVKSVAKGARDVVRLGAEKTGLDTVAAGEKGAVGQFINKQLNPTGKAPTSAKKVKDLSVDELKKIDKNIARLLEEIAEELGDGSTEELIKNLKNHETEGLTSPEITNYITNISNVHNGIKQVIDEKNKSGEKGTSGTAGTAGTQGTAGTAGTQGTAGTAGTQGTEKPEDAVKDAKDAANEPNATPKDVVQAIPDAPPPVKQAAEDAASKPGATAQDVAKAVEDAGTTAAAQSTPQGTQGVAGTTGDYKPKEKTLVIAKAGENPLTPKAIYQFFDGKWNFVSKKGLQALDLKGAANKINKLNVLSKDGRNDYEQAKSLIKKNPKDKGPGISPEVGKEIKENMFKVSDYKKFFL